jgi:hypothetical protein
MGNIFGREEEPSPPPREPPPVFAATRQPLYYGRDFPDEDTFFNRGVRQIRHPRPCPFYARGTCSRGTACRFSHQGSIDTSSIENYRKPCRFFMRGHCGRGEACIFSHEQSSIQKSTEAIKVCTWSPVNRKSRKDWLIRNRMMTVPRVGLVSLAAPGPSSETERQSSMFHSLQTFPPFKYAIFLPVPQQAQLEPYFLKLVSPYQSAMYNI